MTPTIGPQSFTKGKSPMSVAFNSLQHWTSLMSDVVKTSMSPRIFIESWHILGSTRVIHKHTETPFIALYVTEQYISWRCMQLPKEVIWPYCRPQRQEKHSHETGGVWGWVIYIWRSRFQKESHCSVWLTARLLMGPAISPALYLISPHSNPSYLVWLFVLTQAQQIISFATKYSRLSCMAK